MNNKFSETEEQLVSIDEKLIQKPEYKKMLNNLLGIGARDNSTFTSSKTSNFDLSKLISDYDINKVFSSKTFTVDITEARGDDAIEMLYEADDSDEFIEICDANGILLTITDRKLLEKDFDEQSASIIAKIRKQKNQKVAKWKRFKNKYLDIQAQTNSWPLYVGTMFVKVRTNTAVLYAPLILKKVQIEITNSNRIQLKAMDDFVDVNEKLLFLLQNEFKFNLPSMNKDADGFSLDEVLEEYQYALEGLISTRGELIDFKGKFEFLNKTEVNNIDIRYASGAALMIASPSGGDLRNKLIEMINTGDIDDILDFDVMRNVKGEVNERLQKGEGIFRITPTDLSQERAVIGSLEDSSIIWGPPGTGKSQTIANIIANLLYKQDTVIVTSEKKAALDVIQQRMGKLSKFMFFGLTGKDINKEEFYKPFTELANLVQNTYASNSTSLSPKSYILNQEFNYYNQKNKLEHEDIDALSKVYTKIYNNFPEMANRILGFYSVSKSLSNVVENLGSHELTEVTLEKMGIRKVGLFKKYPKNVRIFLKDYLLTNSDVDFVKNLIKIQDINNIFAMDNLKNTEVNYVISRSTFANDEDYLEAMLAQKFRNKIIEMQQSSKYGSQIKTFIKNCQSAYRVPYKFVALYKDVINELFDVFVSTPQTLAATINLDEKYDYAIFDEASQLHLEKAIPYIGMAHKTIIAGDNQQMRPTNYFGVRDKSESIDEVEEDVESLLDYAYRKGLGGSREYMLTKNYRSAASELMAFSSKQFYKEELDVVDKCNGSNKDAIEVYDVKGKWEGRTNSKEAYAMLDKLLEVQDDFSKIILLTLNSNQKQFVESIIYAEAEYAPIVDLLGSGRVLLRNLENIQGDEADLVIVSVAYDKNASLGATYVAKPEGKNALNVAISRAKDKMIVFKSISSEEVQGNVKNDSIRVFREWLSFLEMNALERKEYSVSAEMKGQEFDSEFEEEVFIYLKDNLSLNRKTYLQTQFPVGSYRIDVAIMDEETNSFIYGIEIDGYKYHSGFEKMTKDIERQRFLEAKKYPIYRITELNWKINRNKVIADIKKIIY